MVGLDVAMKTAIETNETFVTTARTVGAEDLLRGDYIAVTNFLSEYPSFAWCDEGFRLLPNVPVKIWWTGSRCSNGPLKVRDVCLPFLLVKTYDRKWLQLDMRTIQFVKLQAQFARKARKRLRLQDRAGAALFRT